VPTKARIKPESRASFSKLEKQRRDLKEIIVVLREISDLSPLGLDLSLDDHAKRLLSERSTAPKVISPRRRVFSRSAAIKWATRSPSTYSNALIGFQKSAEGAAEQGLA
jgi:hypothetical protein